MTATAYTTSAPTCHAGSRLPMSDKYPRIEAACAAVTAAMALSDAAAVTK
jgi:hypothetical protein